MAAELRKRCPCGAASMAASMVIHAFLVLLRGEEVQANGSHESRGQRPCCITDRGGEG